MYISSPYSKTYNCTTAICTGHTNVHHLPKQQDLQIRCLYRRIYKSGAGACVAGHTNVHLVPLQQDTHVQQVRVQAVNRCGREQQGTAAIP